MELSENNASRLIYQFLRDRLIVPASNPAMVVAPEFLPEVEVLVKANRLEPLIHALRNEEDSIPFSDAVEGAYRTEAYRRMLFGAHQMRQALAFSDALKEDGIPCICMRGPFTSQDLYGDPGIRAYNDIDLLVPRGQATDAWRVAQKLGYELFSPHMPVKYFLRHHLHWQLKQPHQNVLCDLHWAVEHPYRLYRIDYDDVFARSVEVSSPHGSWIEPAPVHHLIFTALHIRKHVDDVLSLSLKSGGIAAMARRGEVLHLIDFACLLQKHRLELDWRDLFDVAASWHGLEALAACLSLVQDAFGTEFPEGYLAEMIEAIPVWQRAESVGDRSEMGERALGKAALRGGFRAEKLQDAFYYLTPPLAYFGQGSNVLRRLQRVRHQCVAGVRLTFAGVDTLIATSWAECCTRWQKKKSVETS